MSQPAISDPARPRPVWMEVRQEGRQAVIAILAASDQPVRAAVELDVQGGSSLHTTTRVTISPGQAPVVLSRASIDAHHPWSARLAVTLDGGKSYLVERSDRD